MSDTKELLRKIAALRTRISQPASATATLDDKAQQSARSNLLLERTLAQPGAKSEALPTRLTARGARLLQQSRDSLQTLRGLADDPLLQGDAGETLPSLHAECVALLDVILRAVQGFPDSASAQLRQCEGLEAVQRQAEAKIGVLSAALQFRRREAQRIDALAEVMRRMATGQAIEMNALQNLADGVAADAQAGAPLRFLHADTGDPARFAAAHGLTTAQVLARLLLNDAEWQPHTQAALMAALVHDVGMACVPSEILGQRGPLALEQRRVVEKHTTVGGAMAKQLWPGGGWAVEAVAEHHERCDGTGYPLGRKGMQLASFVHLLAVCDTYAALCSPRPHRPAFDTRAALTETLLLAERDVLDRRHAEKLLALSFFPVGSAVELSDGSHAVVIGAHPNVMTQPTRPVVQVLADAQGQTLATPCVVDLLEARDRQAARTLNADERRTLLGARYPALV